MDNSKVPRPVTPIRADLDAVETVSFYPSPLTKGLLGLLVVFIGSSYANYQFLKAHDEVAAKAVQEINKVGEKLGITFD